MTKLAREHRVLRPRQEREFLRVSLQGNVVWALFPGAEVNQSNLAVSLRGIDGSHLDIHFQAALYWRPFEHRG
jgi:hypothetical protein